MRRIWKHKTRIAVGFRWFVVLGLLGTAAMKFAAVPFDDQFNEADAALPWFTEKRLLLNAALAELFVAVLFLAPRVSLFWRYGSLLGLSALFLCYRIGLAMVGSSCSCAGNLSTNPWVAGGL